MVKQTKCCLGAPCCVRVLVFPFVSQPLTATCDSRQAEARRIPFIFPSAQSYSPEPLSVFPVFPAFPHHTTTPHHITSQHTSPPHTTPHHPFIHPASFPSALSCPPTPPYTICIFNHSPFHPSSPYLFSTSFDQPIGNALVGRFTQPPHCEQPNTIHLQKQNTNMHACLPLELQSRSWLYAPDTPWAAFALLVSDALCDAIFCLRALTLRRRWT